MPFQITILFGGAAMGYQNGSALLPEELLRQSQDYVDGEYLYAGGKKFGDPPRISKRRICQAAVGTVPHFPPGDL